MSIADNLDSKLDAGFVRHYDSRVARRQFQISVALVVILSLAAFALGLMLRFDPPGGDASAAPSMHRSISLDA